MKQITRYPATLNGYTIAAVVKRVRQPSGFNDDEAVILGVDPTRRYAKFVTAYMPLKTETGKPPTEWYIGHYFESLDSALGSLIRRTGLLPRSLQWDRRPSVNLPEARALTIPSISTREAVDEAWKRLGEGI